MGRKRDLLPEFFTNADLAQLDEASRLPCRLAFAGLWTVADREGRFRWDVVRLKLAILPFDSCDFKGILAALVSGGFVRRYVVDGEEFGVIPTFRKHQRVHPDEAQSKLPPPPENPNEPYRVQLDPSEPERIASSSSAPQGLLVPQGLQGVQGDAAAPPRVTRKPREVPSWVTEEGWAERYRGAVGHATDAEIAKHVGGPRSTNPALAKLSFEFWCADVALRKYPTASLRYWASDWRGIFDRLDPTTREIFRERIDQARAA